MLGYIGMVNPVFTLVFKIITLLLGIVPIFCETLFDEVGEKRKEGSETEYQVFPILSVTADKYYMTLYML